MMVYNLSNFRASPIFLTLYRLYIHFKSYLKLILGGWPLVKRIPDLSCIFSWDHEKLVVFIASKTQYLHLSSRHNHPHNYSIENTQLKLFSVLGILGASFSRHLSWKYYILVPSQLRTILVLWSFKNSYSPLYLVCIAYLGWSTHTAYVDKVVSKVFRLVNSHTFTNFIQTLLSWEWN